MLKKGKLLNKLTKYFILSTAIPFISIIMIAAGVMQHRSSMRVITLMNGYINSTAENISMYLNNLEQIIILPYFSDQVMQMLNRFSKQENISFVDQTRFGNAFGNLISSIRYVSNDFYSALIVCDNGTIYSNSNINLSSPINDYDWTEEKWYKDACDILMESSALKDSLDRADNRIKMENVEASYLIERENAEKDLKLKQMQIDSLESSKQTAFLLALLVCLLVLSVILCWLFLYQKRLKKRESDLSARQKRLYEQEKELMAHKEQDYKDSLELRNKELTSKTLYLMRNNEYIADISRELQELLLEMNPKDAAKKNHVREILVKLRNQGNEGAYEEFQYYFEKVYSSFYRNLTQQYPDLTHKDLRLCSFLKLGLSAKEIASITFKEVRSVEMAQYRLRKKMGLDTEVNLIDFFARF